MKLLYKIVKGVEAQEGFIITTIVDTHGSAPGHVGFRMLVFANRSEGSVGGGALEMAVQKEAREILATGKGPQIKEYDLTGLDMNCGGRAVIFFEPCRSKPPVWIFGAGHIARVLAPLVQSTGFAVTVADNRPGFAVAEYFLTDTTLLEGPYESAIAAVPDQAYVVIVTHGHSHDEEIVTGLLKRNQDLPYIGMIGSKRKVTLVLEKMVQNGLTKQENIYTPIGLKLGGDSAEEIALCIAAEILGLYHQAPGLNHCRIHSQSQGSR